MKNISWLGFLFLIQLIPACGTCERDLTATLSGIPNSERILVAMERYTQNPSNEFHKYILDFECDIGIFNIEDEISYMRTLLEKYQEDEEKYGPTLIQCCKDILNEMMEQRSQLINCKPL